MYDALRNVGEIGKCIAGVRDVVLISDLESKWKVEVRAGAIFRTLDLVGRIRETQAPTYIAFAGQGQDVQIDGHVRLSELDPSRTNCQVVITAKVTGAFASLADLMAQGPQRQMINQTIQNLRRLMEPSSEAQAPVDVLNQSRDRRSIVLRFFDWIRAAFKRKTR